MEYIDFLKKTSEENSSIVCVGLDPVLEEIPVKGKDAEAKISKFYSEMLTSFSEEDCLPSAVKPNYAFYAQYGFPGLRALEKIIHKAKTFSLPVIFDGKRGDIGKTSDCYAREAFEFWKADAITIAPYMGTDSVSPFISFAEKKGKGVYILNRTSNAGAIDFQNLLVDGKMLYLKVAEKIIEWGKNSKGNVGTVVGATSLQELEELAKFYAKRNSNKTPLLIPGVGSQGGSAKDVATILKKSGLDLSIQRINSSSAINYAYKKQGTTDFCGAAVKALKKLNSEIGFTSKK